MVFSGAGVSAESGLRTFRDADGLWEQYPIEEVATPEAWQRDPRKVLHFYDLRRAQVLAALPNAAHRAIADLEEWFEVDVVTQNIDDLHERAGSSRVMHLHGEITLARSTVDPTFVTPVNGPSLRWGDRCPLGSQLRPHIVWFGEPVPMIEAAAERIAKADLLVVVGTSLQVYPAAGLVHYLHPAAALHLVDPMDPPSGMARARHWKQKASAGMPALASHLISALSDR
ncbi:MAG TPA: Sir2 family NAD-dependent protein deacetylase [Flavobacteriales bacterium]|nr:Sir2 family NAD-dependent protein deacetylase [Flavobacteriales bacterium]